MAFLKLILGKKKVLIKIKLINMLVSKNQQMTGIFKNSGKY